jgi:hypothetical protein
VLLPDGVLDVKRISRLFEQQSREIDADIASLVLAVLRTAPNRG